MSTSIDSPVNDERAESAAIIRDCRALYLKELGQLLREAEPISDLAVQSFLRSTAAYFDQMISVARRGSFGDVNGLTASCISLVKENDLELEIRLGEFSAKLLESTGGDLWRVYLRFVTLLKRPDLDKSDNPVGPKGIASGLATMCEELGEGHDQTLERISRLQSYFANNLPVLYSNLNNLFERRHIAAAQPSIIATPDAPTSVRAATPPVVNAVAALQQTLMGQMPVAGQPLSGSSAGGSLFSQAMFERLLSRLDNLEKAGRFPAAAPAPGGAASLENLIPGLFDQAPAAPEPPRQAIRSAALGIPSAAPEAAAIDTLALIFEAVFDMPDLPEALKSALSSLQIPLLKSAMIDSSFFANEKHPARALIDRMARLALGVPADASSKHPVCVQILNVAAHVRSEFTQDLAVFERYVTKLDTMISERDQEITQSMQAWLPMLARMDQRTQAETRCQEAIEVFCARGVPQGIANFLRKYWFRVLLQVWVEDGEGSAVWQEQNTVIDHLLWSVQPKIEADDRKRLSRMLPTMLQRLNQGMAHLNVPEAERAEFLDTCFSLQTAALRGVAASPSVTAATTSPLPTLDASLLAAPSAQPEAGELKAGEVHLKTIDIPGEPLQLGRLRPLPIKVGEWLAFNMLDGLALVGRLCHISPESGKLLLCNPDWGYAVAVHPAIMEKQLREKQAVRCSSRSLFNLAAEKALNRPPTS